MLLRVTSIRARIGPTQLLLQGRNVSGDPVLLQQAFDFIDVTNQAEDLPLGNSQLALHGIQLSL